MMLFFALENVTVGLYILVSYYRSNRTQLEVVFFKQKTAYEITRGLEFRRVLFRSQAARHGCGAHRSLQLRADAGARFEFSRAQRATLQMPLNFPAGFFRQFAAEIGIQMPAHLPARGG